MRTILHSDLNNFFASVEIMHDPTLKDKFIAVTGSTESRHGIVLAKNEKAKKMGVKTGEVIWQAKQKCPQLFCVPPHYDWYFEASKTVRGIYERYTDQVEAFSIDECWLDVSASKNTFGDGMKIASEIRESVQKEIGLTVSVGISFNKIFAKLGSDLKKPDAITEVPYETFKEQIWGLPAEELIFIGRATKEKLNRYDVKTIGDVANTSVDFMRRTLGVANQKKLLKKYAEERMLPNPQFYVDDGFTGTNFNRPDFKRMVDDIDAGYVTTVIVKDLSRLGRDYLHVGYYMEQYFPDSDVRFIAINDAVDSEEGENDFTPFKNIMNGMLL